eukprot:s380_g4.t1
MGQSSSVEAAGRDDRCHGLSTTEYAKLQERLSGPQGSQGSKGHLPRVELADFVGCFPAHLRSFVQPLFCYLGKERVGEGSADWDLFVQGFSRATKSGLRWKELLEVWADRGAVQDLQIQSAEWIEVTGSEGPELELCLELAVSLCFWSAFSDRTDVALSPDLAVSVLMSSAVKMDFKSLASWLEGNLPMLPSAVGFCLSQSLLGMVSPAIPEIKSRILEASTHLLLRSCTARLWESDEWMPLYRDWCDGRSFNALLKAEENFKAISQACEVLSSPDKRARYDEVQSQDRKDMVNTAVVLHKHGFTMKVQMRFSRGSGAAFEGTFTGKPRTRNQRRLHRASKPEEKKSEAPESCSSSAPAAPSAEETPKAAVPSEGLSNDESDDDEELPPLTSSGAPVKAEPEAPKAAVEAPRVKRECEEAPRSAAHVTRLATGTKVGPIATPAPEPAPAPAADAPAIEVIDAEEPNRIVSNDDLEELLAEEVRRQAASDGDAGREAEKPWFSDFFAIFGCCGTLFYEAPAVVLLQTQQGHVLGGLSTVWTDNNGKYAGSTECWLFALQPAFTVCKSTSTSGNYAYLNSRNKYAPRGLGFGGQEGFFRLWIDADFEECYVLESDATYSPGLLHPSSGSLQIPFQLAAIEVWGCGGLEAAKVQKAHRERVEGVREQARKVDKARLCDNEFDKEMFLGNTFSATADCREVLEHKKGEERATSNRD